MLKLTILSILKAALTCCSLNGMVSDDINRHSKEEDNVANVVDNKTLSVSTTVLQLMGMLMLI